MTAQRWSQIKDVFFAAREKTEQARNAYLDSACGNDHELRREIELLLDKDNGPSLGRPADNFLGSLVSELAPGQVLAQYRVETKLGEGGMGAVYRAYDTRLRREVALKVLTLDRLADPESKQRLLREARAASALNHPNIVTVHEIGSYDGVDFIALEFIQGKSLEELIPAKGLPIEKAMDYAVQIAGALAKAHAAGIIHRDLKPGNIMVTPDGLVKILDFGLAKLTQPARGDISESRSSKEEAAATEEGTILGTVAYMSPEQAEGKPVDARSDIFSFGSVLYEMTTGRRAFHGDTKLSTLSAILKEEPKAVSTVVPHVPRELEKIISRCMRKLPERRLQHMDDVKTLLEELKEESDSGKLEPATVGALSRRKPPLLLALVVAAVLVAAGAGIWLLRPTSSPVPTSAPLTSYPGQQTDPAFSPDGKQVAFAWDGEEGGNFDIYVKLVDAGAPLRLTRNRADEYAPAWSPDGRYIAFCRDVAPRGASIAFQMRPVEIWTVPALGGAERKLGEAATCGGLSWSPDGSFLALVERNPPQAPAAIFLLTIETGEKRRLTTPPNGFDADSVPRFSPDGKTLAFIRAPTSPSADIYVLPIRNSGRSVSEPRRLTFRKQNVSGLDWTADGRRIVFASDQGTNSSLWTVAASGGIVDHLHYAGENAHGLSLSRTGNRLVYERSIWDSNIWRVPGPNSSEMNNDPIRLIASTQMDKEPQFAPDGQRIAFSSTRSGNYEIWVCDHEGHNPFQLTSSNGSQHVGSPRWSPDSKWIAFDSNSKAGNGDIYIISANGGPPRTLTTGPSNNVRPSWSHDGNWIYFGSNRSGASQIWKEPAAGGAAVQVTRRGGEEAFESTDGKFVYWAKLSEDGIWRVPVDGGDETQVLDVPIENHWTLTAQGICFFDLSNAAGPALKFYSFATHRRTLLKQFSKGIRVDMVSTALSVSPDGRWILYTQLDQAGSNLVLVENFR